MDHRYLPSNTIHFDVLGSYSSLIIPVGVPAIRQGKVSSDIGGIVELSWGSEETWTKHWEESQTFSCPAWSSLRAEAWVTTGELTMPIVAVYKSPSTGTKARRWGTWKSKMSYDLEFYAHKRTVK